MTGLFDGVLNHGPLGPLTDDSAWLQALLDAEAALARALVVSGHVTDRQAETIAAACQVDRFDPAALGRAAEDGGNPVIPLVKQLTAHVHETDPEAARHVHRGATSQDIMDTAAMLLVRRAGRALHTEMCALTTDLHGLADHHRTTPMPGRTLLQQALPTTFGAVAAGWAAGLTGAAERLEDVLTHHLAAQLGGAVGTLASLESQAPPEPHSSSEALAPQESPATHGAPPPPRTRASPGSPALAVAAAFAERLGLPEPLLPWHTERGRVTEIAAALGRVCGAVGTTAQDVVLLTQTEVGELTEEGGGGVGGSSTMPHKRNPVAAVSALAAARQAPGLVATLFAAQIQEHQRAAGAWHAEWLPLTDLLRRTGSAVSWLRVSVQRLRVHPDRMRANLDLTRGLALSERLTTDLAPELGRLEAHRRVTDACREAVDQGRDPVEVLAEHLRVLRTRERISALLDPADYLGAAPVFTDRVTGRTGQAGPTGTAASRAGTFAGPTGTETGPADTATGPNDTEEGTDER
ncbi:3-carboxy-cis,cis-muconate cycloisomerase [Nocardiopsis metallicus]|uniref:3-carboxy-cis,cis-muconate cycloisomerase n=1 Tax=Nocardiopsis metallicus TaxID=179819 RepID=A0A840WED7_9ACTN|nr:3-carboxy-cis,cis-muconate cycloisomerase [Nocardiopsis metallicus]MBB5490077.1 3-carboxy-cis,cis-muconate cycloisomerase [Nocardiopsis metallicus]